MTLLPTSILVICDSAKSMALDSRRSCSRARGSVT